MFPNRLHVGTTGLIAQSRYHEGQSLPIDDLQGLAELIGKWHGASAPYPGSVQLTFLKSDDTQRMLLEADLNRYLRACGCGIASAAVATFVAILVFAHFVVGINIPAPAPWSFIFAAITAGLIGTVAKLAAIYHAKWRMRQLFLRASLLGKK